MAISEMLRSPISDDTQEGGSSDPTLGAAGEEISGDGRHSGIYCNHLASFGCSCSGIGLTTTTQYVEALKLASIKMGAQERRAEPVAQPATEKARVGCVSLWAKGGERAFSLQLS
jgi:hypothetical protein